MTDSIDLQYRKQTELESSKTGTGWSQWGLAICKVIFIDYENHTATLQGLAGSVGGENKDQFPAPITYPGGGTRSFLGMMPCVGDFCVVGWISSNSSGQASARRPLILNWFPPPPGLAHDWLPAQEFEHGEGMDTYGARMLVKGSADRARFKLRHMEPGNIVASSSQGADLVLDESARLTNRRGNEIVLRDQDQSMVLRSVAQHTATSGTRIYAGPAQRDANILPKEVFSDGKDYETVNLEDYMSAVSNSEFWGTLEDSVGVKKLDTLHPALPFRRNKSGESIFSAHVGNVPIGKLDPFKFLAAGGFIDGEGRAKGIRKDFSYYGGKSFFRPSLPPPAEGGEVVKEVDGATDVRFGMLPEFRVEVEHKADGTLPVTEQTEGFDAERLPSGEGNASIPLAELVLGSVIGNNVYGEPELYGKPISARLDGPVGRLESGLKKPIGDHAAALLRVNPTDTTKASTWIAVRKDGKVIASLANGLEMFVKNGYKFATASPLELGSSEETAVRAGTQLTLESQNSCVVIEGAKPTAEGSSMNLLSNAEESQAKDGPAVHVRAKQGNVKIESGRNVDFTTQSKFRFTDAKGFVTEVKDQLVLNSGSKMSLSGGAVEEMSTKTTTRTHSGGNPLDGPCLKVSIPCNPATGAVAPQLVQDDYFMLMGSCLRKHVLGDKTEIMGTGMKTEVLAAGVHTATVGPNSIVHTPGGYVNTVAVGAIVQTAAAGAISQVASVGISSTTSGVNTAVAASHVVTAPGNASAPGFAITSGSLCPVSGRPLLICTNFAAGTLIA
ncbi:MAG: hypothetical protein VXX11_03050 [Planctomycetota bacterium]|nr:hypothetical protein [Planctomycetota bacterium]